MSVQKRIGRNGRVSWQARVEHEGRHIARTFRLKADADAWEADARRRAQLGAYGTPEPAKSSLAAWLRAWWDRDAHRWQRSTRNQRASVLDKWIVPHLGAVRMRDLGPPRVRDFQRDIRAAGCTPAQTNAVMRVLSAALGAAVRDGQLPGNPCEGIEKIPRLVERPQPLTPLEVERIRAAMPTARDMLAVGLLAYAGLRPEEALALRWIDVRPGLLVIDRAFTHGELKATKTHQRRTVEILPPLVADLDMLRPGNPGRDDLVIPALRAAHLALNNWRPRVWDVAANAAGVGWATPYTGRHTYASLLIHAGRSPLIVAASLGHADAHMTFRNYAHIYDEAALAPMTDPSSAIREAREAVMTENGLHEPCVTPDPTDAGTDA